MHSHKSPRKPRPAARNRPAAAGRPDPSDGSYWMFGLHAVRAALQNPNRVKRRLILTANAAHELEASVAASGLTPELADPRRFDAPLDANSVHQGAALWVEPLDWGDWTECCVQTNGDAPPRVLLLDRVTDPHNVGAILRSAVVFGAQAVLAPARHSAPETGALAKSASGALEQAVYIRVKNLSSAMKDLHNLGFILIGLDGEGSQDVSAAAAAAHDRPLGLVLGAEGPGLREKTRANCDSLARIPGLNDPERPFASLNVSNAAAVALYGCSNTV